MTKRTRVHKTAHQLKVEQEKLGGECSIHYIIERLKRGATMNEIATALGVSRGTLRNWRLAGIRETVTRNYETVD